MVIISAPIILVVHLSNSSLTGASFRDVGNRKEDKARASRKIYGHVLLSTSSTSILGPKS